MKNDWLFFHVSVSVKNINNAIQHYKSIGAVLVDGPIEITTNPKDFKYFSKTPSKPIKYLGATLQIGSLTLDLHQPVEGESPWQEFLDKHGEGVDHISFYVDDVKKEADKIVAKGFPVVLKTTMEGKWESVYLDTRDVGNIEIELINKTLMDARIAKFFKHN